jgi:stress response protein YsnF
MRLIHRSDHINDPPLHLPLEVAFEPPAAQEAGHWGRTLRLGVMRQRVRVEKQPFVYEEVVLGIAPTKRVVGIDELVKRERLRVDTTPGLSAEEVHVHDGETRTETPR